MSDITNRAREYALTVLAQADKPDNDLLSMIESAYNEGYHRGYDDGYTMCGMVSWE